MSLGPARNSVQQLSSADTGAVAVAAQAQPMMSLQQALQWIPASRLIGDGKVGVARVHSDTRTLQMGDFFVALSGERFDGNQFLRAAREAGAAAAMAQHGLAEAGLPGLQVADTRIALGQLAQGWRQQFELPLIAVTGSNGKTTVTQMLASILRCHSPNRSLATLGNLNNDIGVPLTLLRLRPEHDIAVLELGMNHVGEIAYLAHLVAPTVALINNAQREHLEFMDSVQAVAQENGAVIHALPPQGSVVLPAADPFAPLWRTMADGRAVLSFGLAGETAEGAGEPDVVASSWHWRDGAWQVRLSSPQGELDYLLMVAGQHNLRNSVAAAAGALAAGVSLAAIAAGLGQFQPVRGRSAVLALRISGQPLTLVDDSYNANPDSVRAAIDLLAGLPGPHLLVLGDMAEVGSEGPAFHAEVGDYARQRGIERLNCLGSLSVHSAQAFGAATHFEDMQALLAGLERNLGGMASVLVKGSRSMGMERVSAAIGQLAQSEAVPC